MSENELTEKEKMLRGQLYDPGFDSGLAEDRKRVKDLCFKFNNTQPSKKEKLQALSERLPESAEKT